MTTLVKDAAVLASVLNGTRTWWSNGLVDIKQDNGVYTWITPCGGGTSTNWEDALLAIAPHLIG